MKKVININFQGQVIAIEETAYELLKQYIDSLKSYFSKEEGGSEIVNDIENRIAELFGNRLKHGIICITDEDVQSIIENIGEPEEFDTEYKESSYVNTESTKETSPNSSTDAPKTKAEEPRTLYRNSNDKIIAGVCSGLAHYFKIDPVWIRLIFVLLFGLFFWIYLLLWIIIKPMPLESNVTKRLYRNPNDRFIAGVCGGIAAYFKINSWIPRLIFATPFLLKTFGSIYGPFFPWDTWDKLWHNINFGLNINSSILTIYIVLWIIIPKAVTVKQKLEMMGEEDYIKSIKDTVNENIANVKNKSGNETIGANNAISDQMPPTPSQNYLTSGSTPSLKRSGCLNAILIFLKIIVFSLVGISVISLFLILVGCIITGVSLVPLKTLFINHSFDNILFYTSLILIVALPIISTIIWIVRRSLKKESKPIIGAVVSILFFIGFILAIILVSRTINNFKEECSSERVMQISPFLGDTLKVEMLPYQEDYYKFRTSFYGEPFIDNLPYYNLTEDSLLFSNIGLQVIDSKDSLFHVKIRSTSSDRDLRNAKKMTKEFTYNIQQKGATLLLPKFFRTSIKQGFHNQNIFIEILTPKGKEVKISENLDDYNYESIHKKNRRYSQKKDVDDEDKDKTIEPDTI